LNDPVKILPIEALLDAPISISSSFSVNYGMDTNRVAAEDLEERNKRKARELLEYMLANPASSRNNSAKRTNTSSRRSVRNARTPGITNDVEWDNAFLDDPTTRPISFNADKVQGYFDDRSTLYTTSVTSPKKGTTTTTTTTTTINIYTYIY